MNRSITVVSIKRVAEGPRELLLWGARQRRLQWAWGETDCGTLMRQGLKLVFGQTIMEIEYTSREEAQAWMKSMGKTASKYFESLGASRQKKKNIQGADVIVRPGTVNGMPRLALALDHEVLLTSDPEQGPHWIGVSDLRRRARVYRFDCDTPGRAVRPADDRPLVRVRRAQC